MSFFFLLALECMNILQLIKNEAVCNINLFKLVRNLWNKPDLDSAFKFGLRTPLYKLSREFNYIILKWNMDAGIADHLFVVHNYFSQRYFLIICL